MSSSESESEASPAQSRSTDLSLEIILLECGHGDTILVRLPLDRWIMIDCNLKGGTRDKLFNLFKEKDITRLEAVILSHPHSDHYHGMRDVLEYFSTEGRTFRLFCDCGVDPGQIYGLMHEAKDITEGEKREYAALHVYLDSILDRPGIGYVPVGEHTDDIIRFKIHDENIRLIPIGPDPSYFRSVQRETISSNTVRGSLNALSLILLLQIPHSDGVFNVLLTGDAQSDGLERAFTILHSGEKGTSDALEVHGLKVPHHGSATSRSPILSQSNADHQGSIAAISVGAKFAALPAHEILRDYIDAGWKVLLTTKRIKRKPRTYFRHVSRPPDHDVDTHSRQDLRILWDPEHGISWDPPDALLDESELHLYETSEHSPEASPAPTFPA